MSIFTIGVMNNMYRNGNRNKGKEENQFISMY